MITTSLFYTLILFSSSTTSLFTYIINLLLMQIELPIELIKVAALTSSCFTLNYIMNDKEIKLLVLIRKRGKGKPKFNSVNSTNKGLYHIMKMISFWYKGHVIVFLFNSNVVLGDNKSITITCDHSLIKIDSFNKEENLEKEKISRGSIDIGGRGTREGFM